MELEGKVALITGAGDGIGRGIALHFAGAGAKVGVFDIDAAACVTVAAEIESQAGTALALPGDVTDAQAIAQSINALVEAYGPPVVLVHNAAIMPGGAIDETSEADWDRVFAVNVKGAYLTSRAVLPHMRRVGGGVILFMASITGVNGLPGLAAYSATKGALISLARAMAIDHAREGVRVNSVSPGTIDSPMLHNFVAQQADPQATRAAFDEIHPVGRVGTIDEVAEVFVFLASARASFITGTNIQVDGGMSIKGEQPRL